MLQLPRKCQTTTENFWKVSGQQLLCHFGGNTRKQATHKIQSPLLLSLLRKTAHVLPAKRLQRGLSLQHRDWRLELLLCHCSLDGRLCALCLSLLSFLSQSHRAGALASSLLWKIFTLVGEGISLMLSHRLEAVVPIPRCHLCSTR